MDCLKVTAGCLSFVSLVMITIALVTNYWIVDSSRRHAGLWQMCYDTVCVPHGMYVLEFIHITRGLLLIGMLAGAVSFFSFCASLFHTHNDSILIERLPEIASFVATCCSMVAMAVFTRVYYHDFFLPGTWMGWSAMVGWVSVPMFLVTSLTI